MTEQKVKALNKRFIEDSPYEFLSFEPLEQNDDDKSSDLEEKD